MWPFDKADSLDIPGEIERRVSEQVEIRESNYTQTLVALLQQQTAGRIANPANPSALGAVETCAGLWGRCMASAEMGGQDVITAALTPSFLALVGRCLVKDGEVVFRISTSSGRLLLMPAMSFSVTGGPDPTEWQYLTQTSGPSESVSVSLPADSVLHFKYATEAASPWRGISPLTVAYLAGALGAETIKALSDESSGPRGSFLPLPGTTGDDESVAAIKQFVPNAAGKMGIVESAADDFGAGGGSGQNDFKQVHFGPAPTTAMVELAQAAKLEIYGALGVSPGLFSAAAASSIREAMRVFLMTTLLPVSKLVLQELREKLDDTLTLDFEEVRSVDAQGRSRALASMVQAGMQLEKAVALSGLMVSDDD